jgi:hypothetical protein
MATHKKSEKREITIRDLYPALTDDQLQEAEENLRRYTELSLQAYERIRSEPKLYKQFQVSLAEHKEKFRKNERKHKGKL